MSNTSMSMHTQSMVQGTDTERAHMLKDSGVTLHEDSTVVHDNDDARVSMTKQNHEILNRQLASNNNYIAQFCDDDTPLMRRELDEDDERQKYRSHQSGKQEFIMCRDTLQVEKQNDSSDMPHLNKTTSIVVSEAFKVKNMSKAHPKQGNINYRLVTGSGHQNISKRSSGESSICQSRDTNTIASVKDSIDSLNTAKKRINLSHMVPQPQILTKPKKSS